jgi:glucose/arabinose dehydrogenase
LVTTGDSGNRDLVPFPNNANGSIIRPNDEGSNPENNHTRKDNNETIVFQYADTRGRVPIDAPEDSVCGQIFANGVRNPFRIAMDPKEKRKSQVCLQYNTWCVLSLHYSKN